MEKYYLKNYRTRRFSQKTFDEQVDYYIVADVVLADNPAKILDVVPYWGSGDEEIVRKSEEQSVPLPKKFYEPFYGEFVAVTCDTLLLRRYTEDDAYRGLCDEGKVGTYVCNPDGSYRLFNSIRVFCIVNPSYIKVKNDPRLKDVLDLNIPRYLPKWEPEYRAEHKKRYCYVELTV
ncbi:MAG: hypothetical protein J5658_07935 [Prevotella sp.]|nr:hypothetical protein [Prevotella sp.]